MGLTVVLGKQYVARIIGGGADSQESLDAADEAIRRGYQDWQNKRDWRFLLRDTSIPTRVTGVTATLSSASVSPPSAGEFDFVNVGQTVTVSGTATLVAGTTVSAVTRGSDGVVTSITLSNSFGGTTDTAAVLSFSANIPIFQGTNDYALPNDFGTSYTARFLTLKRTLTWRDPRYWDRTMYDPDTQGTPSDYTTYNPYSPATQNFGFTRLTFDRVPSADDTLFLRYYRRFNPNGTYIDMPDEYLYQFLDYCRNILLATKRAQDNPANYAKNTTDATNSAAESDEDQTEDDDVDECIKSQYEMGYWARRALWNNGAFDPTREY